MSAMREPSRPRGEWEAAQPCPSCGRPMYLARTTPRSGGLAPLNTYRCGECGVSLTEAADERSAA